MRKLVRLSRERYAKCHRKREELYLPVSGATFAISVEIYTLRGYSKIRVLADRLLQFGDALLTDIGIDHRPTLQAHQVGVGRQIGVVTGQFLKWQFTNYAGLFKQSQSGINRGKRDVGEEITDPLKNLSHRGVIRRIDHHLRDGETLWR